MSMAGSARTAFASEARGSRERSSPSRGSRQVQVGDAVETEATAGALFQGGPLGLQELDHPRADGAEPEEPEAHLSHGRPVSARAA